MRPLPRTRHGFSALELSGVMTIIALLICGLVWWGNRTLRQSREVACGSNLKQIALAMTLYAQDYGGRLPASASTMPYIAKVYTKNDQLWICPADRSPSVRGVSPASAQPPAFLTSYFIVPGYATDDPPNSVVAGDTEARHAGRWNAACLDGRVLRLPASDLPRYAPQRSQKP